MTRRILAAIAALGAIAAVTIGSLTARADVAQTNSTFEPLTPARILDTRTSGALGADSQIDLQVVGQGGVPAGATAVVVNLTVTEPDASSYLTLWPTGEPRPEASNINFVAGRTIANLVTVKLSADGRLTIYNFAGSVHVLVDVNGYYHSTLLGTGGSLPAMRSGGGAPAGSVGNVGDYYQDLLTGRLYGPKNVNGWAEAPNPGLAGYEIVSNNAPGNVLPRVAQCSKGKKPIGGGTSGALTVGQTVVQSFPVEGGWSGNTAVTYAVCVFA
ncbi:MAG: hypothetical protein AB7L13_12780 [Acidimicrobiia bacterium]